MASKSLKTKGKRESILDAATELFVRHGAAGTSMDAISERAGVSKRTVYNHFGSKDALFEAIVVEFHGQKMHGSVANVDPSLPLRAKLEQIVEARLTGLLEESTKKFIRMLLAEFMRSPNLARDLGKRLKDPKQDPMIPLLLAAGEQIGLTEERALRRAEQLWSLMFGLIFWPQVVMHEEHTLEQSKALIGEALDMFFAAYPEMA